MSSRPNDATAPVTDQDLERLVNRYLDGDEQAFAELYRAAAPRVFGYLFTLTRDAARAEDLVQVTFEKLHRARRRFAKGSPIMPWLFAIARNAFRDEYRGIRARNEGVTLDGELPERGTRVQARHAEAREEMMQALGTVTKKQRDAVVLTKLLGFSVAEAAAIVGTTANSLKIRVHRGLRALQDYAWA